MFFLGEFLKFQGSTSGHKLCENCPCEEIIEKHTYYLQGSFFYLANDLFVPEFTRNDAKRFGLCKDEFVKYNNWPPQLYIRSSNRLRGMKIMTQNNVANPRKKINSIAMGFWEFEQHTMARSTHPTTPAMDRTPPRCAASRPRKPSSATATSGARTTSSRAS